MVITAGVYVSAYKGEFFLDDCDVLTRNTSVREWHGLRAFLSNDSNVTRPVVQLTFVLDYLLWGNDAHPFHILNVLLHAGCAALLFAIARRGFLAPRWKGAFASSAVPLAFAAALLWALHPLQTESVTYVVQRHENMMGFFLLLSLYFVIRGAESPRRMAWHAGALVAAVLGAGCKQSIVVLPLIVLLYDRCCISGTFGAALKRAPEYVQG